MSGITNKIYRQRGNFALIGLTGRTGSGCSTVAGLLCLDNFGDFGAPIPFSNGNKITNEDRKYRICYDYMKEDKKRSVNLKLSNLIVFLFLFYDFEKIVTYTETHITESVVKLKEKSANTSKNAEKKSIDEKIEHLTAIIDFFKTETLVQKYKAIHEKYFTTVSDHHHYLANREYKKTDLNETDTQRLDEIIRFIDTELPLISNAIKLISKEYNTPFTYVELLQFLGNYSRHQSYEGKGASLIILTNDVIKLFRHKYNSLLRESLIIVIDSLRNPYEVLYLRERYSAFYLMAINANEVDRKKRLNHLTSKQIALIDDTEYPLKPSLRDKYLHQNIERCTELADIHILNEDDDDPRKHQLKRQLLLYLALIKHPGLVTPTPEERTMQIAYTAKFNSGCLSRQVGAVVTDESFSIKSLGWNNTPEGHTPCLLRDCRDLIAGSDKTAYSKYEITTQSFLDSVKDYQLNKTIEHLNELKGRHSPYCFKDIYKKMTGHNNQVHTRSLHAEENAFLQISKYGGSGIKGGKLFTTASPCELCAKKAYQLGIKEIYYIDLYPGISQDHILNCGLNAPKMNVFKGAIGRAYLHLYHPILSYKDEVYDILEID